ncbi:MAG TPA: hydroxymethylbilane synthase [Candidatus Paceibacterota bacterium]|nr:hydroxymethylbilane synthase [Candidatus Paceibacterota bacterium]
MAEIKSLIIGTRGSKLALVQAQLVADALTAGHPGIAVQIKAIVTKGDLNQAPIPLDTIGKNWFTAEIEQALLKGDIDIAVHSLKDLPPETPEGIITIPVLERADPRDVLISKSGLLLADLPHGAVIGTDSIRRKILLKERRSDLTVRSIRGNVDTRLKKLADEDYDALVLAAAGLARVGISSVITEFLDPAVFIPAIGQGALAAQVRKDRAELLEAVHGIEHAPTRIAAEAEQAFSTTVGGGCKLPIGCYARVEGDRITIDGFIGNADSYIIARKSTHGPARDGIRLAEELAKELL